MNAPKKIWVDEEMTAWVQYSEDDIPYIRADIVDELVEALDAWASSINIEDEEKAMRKSAVALAKLEESHD